jgi:hypothetical protein
MHPPIAPADSFEPLDPSSLTLLPLDFQLVGGVQNWRTNWSVIVTGTWSNSPFSGLLCYERDKGVAAFYETDGVGGIQLLQEYSDWRQSWTFIVPGVFGDSGYDGLLLYDQQAGFAAFYDTDGQGNLILLHEDSTWRSTWSHIVVAPFNDQWLERNGFSVDRLVGNEKPLRKTAAVHHRDQPAPPPLQAHILD